MPKTHPPVCLRMPRVATQDGNLIKVKDVPIPISTGGS